MTSMKTKRTSKSDTGFTMLEILIALAILLVGVASVVNMFPVGLQAAKRGADFSSAGILAQQKMAQLMYLGYENWNSLDSGLDGSIPMGGYNSGLKERFPPPDDAYSWHIDIQRASVSNLARITLWIYWNDRGSERYEPFITYIAKRD